MTDDEVARWFAQPNTWLNGAVPAQTLVIDFPAVLATARARLHRRTRPCVWHSDHDLAANGSSTRAIDANVLCCAPHRLLPSSLAKWNFFRDQISKNA